ncbi:MAG TPA: hypothetical protein VE991_15105, partial [Acidimicrobiales bacterium]|nr:hypothetical protein [Acidimicrobiales bacterium]
MTLLSRPHPGRVRILRHEDGAAPAATALSYEPVVPATRPGAAIDEQLRAARAAGFDEGYQQGLAEGRQAAQSAHVELLAQTCQALMEAAAATAGNRAAAVASAERDAVELAFELAESLLQRELSISRSRAVDAL